MRGVSPAHTYGGNSCLPWIRSPEPISLARRRARAPSSYPPRSLLSPSPPPSHLCVDSRETVAAVRHHHTLRLHLASTSCQEEASWRPLPLRQSMQARSQCFVVFDLVFLLRLWQLQLLTRSNQHSPGLAVTSAGFVVSRWTFSSMPRHQYYPPSRHPRHSRAPATAIHGTTMPRAPTHRVRAWRWTLGDPRSP